VARRADSSRTSCHAHHTPFTGSVSASPLGPLTTDTVQLPHIGNGGAQRSHRGILVAILPALAGAFQSPLTRLLSFSCPLFFPSSLSSSRWSRSYRPHTSSPGPIPAGAEWLPDICARGIRRPDSGDARPNLQAAAADFVATIPRVPAAASAANPSLPSLDLRLARCRMTRTTRTLAAGQMSGAERGGVAG